MAGQPPKKRDTPGGASDRAIGIFDRADRFLGVEAGLRKRWVQHERHYHDYVLETWKAEIRAIYESIE